VINYKQLHSYLGGLLLSISLLR